MAQEGNITLLLKSGFDAFTNLWDVTINFPGSASGKTDGKEISLRVSDFTPPKVSLDTYKIQYKGTELERFKALLQYKDNRELTLKFRLDGSYGLLEDLQRWKNLYYNASGDGNMRFGFYSNSASDTNDYGTVTVKAYRSVAKDKSMYTLDQLVSTADENSDHIGAQWVFNQVALLDVNVSGYSRDKSEAQTVECLFVYGEFSEPYTTDSSLTSRKGGGKTTNTDKEKSTNSSMTTA